MSLENPLNIPDEPDHSRLTRSRSGRIVKTNGFGNKLAPEDKAFHDWYRFVLSFPAHLVTHYLQDFGVKPGQVVLDPFCGTGTTLVQAKLDGFESVGVEANPIAHLASSVKTNWQIDPIRFMETATQIGDEAQNVLRKQGIDDLLWMKPFENLEDLRSLSEEEGKLILDKSISPLPLHKSLVLRDILDAYQSEEFFNHLRLALAKTLVFRVSNLHFGPEVGVGKPREDAQVIQCWLSEVKKMGEDLNQVRNKAYPKAIALLADSRNIGRILEPSSVDAVITSPPYPNEKDYTRTTRLESVILGYIRDKQDLQNLKKNLIRSNTRGVYKEDNDHEWVEDNPIIQDIAKAIENRRIELGKTSGFERMYGKVTKLYFGGMARHLSELRQVLKPGAQLGYVVGDQASYLQVMIRTGQLIADIAEGLGYEVLRIDLFRTRFATATKQELREEVVILRWKG